MTYREDSELGLRLARSGVEIVIDPELEIEHRCPATDAATRAGRAFTSGASTVAFETRHPGTHSHSGSAPTSPWDRARRARPRDGSTRAETRTHSADGSTHSSPALPQRVHGKAVALAVEAAAAAGRRVGDSALGPRHTEAGRCGQRRRPPLRRSRSHTRPAPPASRPDAPRAGDRRRRRLPHAVPRHRGRRGRAPRNQRWVRRQRQLRCVRRDV